MNTEEVKIISLWQPWASLIILGLKQYETRSWSTSYRGRLAIHAAKRKIDITGIDVYLKALSLNGASSPAFDPNPFQYGCIVAVVDLTDCLLMKDWDPPQQGKIDIDFEVTELEDAVGDWQPGRYAWKLENVQPLAQPIPFRGSQGLRTIQDTAVLRALKKQSEEMINA